MLDKSLFQGVLYELIFYFLYVKCNEGKLHCEGADRESEKLKTDALKLLHLDPEQDYPKRIYTLLIYTPLSSHGRPRYGQRVAAY